MEDEAKANLVSAAISEDRTELRLLKDRIYSTTALVVTASFGVTAFLLGDKAGINIENVSFKLRLFSTIIDGALLLVLWILFLRLLVDLKAGQLWLEARQNVLDELTQGHPLKEPLRIYAMDFGDSLGISHNSMYWIAASASAAIVIKLAALWLLHSEFFTAMAR
jgi:hypothetical protein